MTPRLLRRIRADFGDASDRIVAELTSIPSVLPGGERQDPERMQAALVLAARGEEAHFAALVQLAHVDWRDVLVAADLADGHWESQLDRLLGTTD